MTTSEAFEKVVHGEINSRQEIEGLLAAINQRGFIPPTDKDFYRVAYLSSLLSYSDAVKNMLPEERQVPDYACSIKESLETAKMDVALMCLNNQIPPEGISTVRQDKITSFMFDKQACYVTYGIGISAPTNDTELKKRLDTIWNMMQSSCDKDKLMLVKEQINKLSEEYPEINAELGILNKVSDVLIGDIQKGFHKVSVTLDNIEHSKSALNCRVYMKMDSEKTESTSYDFNIRDFLAMDAGRCEALLHEAEELNR